MWSSCSKKGKTLVSKTMAGGLTNATTCYDGIMGIFITTLTRHAYIPQMQGYQNKVFNLTITYKLKLIKITLKSKFGCPRC